MSESTTNSEAYTMKLKEPLQFTNSVDKRKQDFELAINQVDKVKRESETSTCFQEMKDTSKCKGKKWKGLGKKCLRFGCPPLNSV